MIFPVFRERGRVYAGLVILLMTSLEMLYAAADYPRRFRVCFLPLPDSVSTAPIVWVEKAVTEAGDQPAFFPASWVSRLHHDHPQGVSEIWE